MSSPVKQKENRVVAEMDAPPPQRTANPDEISLLIVDDEHVIRRLMRDVLSDEGYNVHTEGSTEEALAWLESHTVDIIISDIYLPKRSGMELLREVRELYADTDVIMITGYGTLKSAVESMKLGALDYLTKPLNVDEIRIVIANAAERQRLRRKAAEADFYKQLSRVDALTHLYNRRFFQQMLDTEVFRAERYGHPLSLGMLDIDRFKNFNDANGHPAGDAALKQLSDLFLSNVRHCDVVARYGGEEFAILLPETPKSQATVLVERLVRRVAETTFPGEERMPGGCLRVSAGVAAFPGDASTAEDLMECADKALYLSKANGRNIVTAYDPQRKKG